MEECLPLGPDPESPRLARQFVAERLTAWGYDGMHDEAVLLVSELVMNAVVHADGPLTLDVGDLGDGIVVAVADSMPAEPMPRVASSSETTGRGLMIVQGIATAWGVASLRQENGKLVWFRLGADGTTESVPGAQSPAPNPVRV